MFPMQVKLLAQNSALYGNILIPQALPIHSGIDYTEASTTGTVTNAGNVFATFYTVAGVDYVIAEKSRVLGVIKWERYLNPTECVIDNLEGIVEYGTPAIGWTTITSQIIPLYSTFAKSDGHTVINLGSPTQGYMLSGNQLRATFRVYFHSETGNEVGVRLWHKKERDDTYLLLPLTGE